MRRSTLHFALTLLLALAAASQPALPQDAGSRRGGDIRSTKHNLTGLGSAGDSRAVCVYCHTPALSDANSETESEVGAQSVTMSDQMPRWQPGLPSGDVPFEYGIYDDIGKGSGVGSQSMACLSCHDNTQAMGAEANDHPIGVPYRGAVSFDPLTEGSEPPADAIVRRARFLQNTADFKPARKGTINQREVWWVPTSDSGFARTRQDIQLYVRERADSYQSKQPFLECSSCHDPHSTNRLFLRVANTESRLCLSCHDK